MSLQMKNSLSKQSSFFTHNQKHKSDMSANHSHPLEERKSLI